MRRVVVHRAAREAEASGDRERATVVLGEAECVSRDLHRRGEAGIEVEACNVVDADVRRRERAPGRERDRRRRRERCTFGDEPVVVGPGRAVQAHHAVVGHAGVARVLVRRQEQRRALVDVDVGAHALRIRERDHPVLGRHRPDLGRCERFPRPCMRIGGRDLRERRPQLAHVPLMLVDRPTRGRAERGLEEGIDQRRRDRQMGRFVVARAGPIFADHPPAGRVVARFPHQLDSWFSARPPPRVDALGAAEQRDIELAPLYPLGELVDEQLWTVAADGRHRCRARRDAEMPRHKRARIGVRPRHDLDDGNDVDVAKK